MQFKYQKGQDHTTEVTRPTEEIDIKSCFHEQINLRKLELYFKIPNQINYESYTANTFLIYSTFE